MITDHELDLLVVEKVMEMKPARIWKLGTHDGSPPEFVIPPYSTDISAAWEVVEKMSTKKWCFDLQYAGSRPTATFRLSYVCRGERYESKEDTAPRAICLAALKAMGHEI